MKINRSYMGEYEFGSVRVHEMLRNPSIIGNTHIEGEEYGIG